MAVGETTWWLLLVLLLIAWMAVIDRTTTTVWLCICVGYKRIWFGNEEDEEDLEDVDRFS